MKPQTAKDMAGHLEKMAREYRSTLYRVANNYNPFADIAELAKELTRIVHDMGEKESDY